MISTATPRAATTFRFARRRTSRLAGRYLLLIAVLFVTVGPLLWQVSALLKGAAEPALARRLRDRVRAGADGTLPSQQPHHVRADRRLADRLPDPGRLHALADGSEVGRAENMHRRHRFEVMEALRAGEAELVVCFASAARIMRERAAAGEDLPYDWAYPYNRLRVMASPAGWDWGPTLVSAGIWRPARLVEVPGDRLEVALTTTLDDGLAAGTLVLDATVDPADTADTAPRTLDVRLGDERWAVEVAPGQTRIELPVVRPALWWPRGHGEPVLHDVEVALRGSAERSRGRVGFLVNDTDRVWSGETVARRVRFGSGERSRVETPFLVPPRSVATMPLGPELTLPGERRDELLVVDTGPARPDGSHRAVRAFVADDGIRWPQPELDVAVSRDPADPLLAAVAVTARTAVGDLCLLADRLAPAATVDSALVTLLPGERHTFLRRTAAAVEPDRLRWPVLIGRNHFFYDRSR